MGWNRALRAVAALALTACVGTTIRDPHAGQFKLTFHNEAGGPVCALHIYPHAQAQPGNNFLDPDTEIPTGDSIDYWLEPGTYQIRAEGCPYEKQKVGGFAPQVILNQAGVAVLFREDDAKSKDAAQTIVHDNHNGTMIPAKLTANSNASKKPTIVRPARTNARGQSPRRASM
jgi:hypothetical protein